MGYAPERPAQERHVDPPKKLTTQQQKRVEESMHLAEAVAVQRTRPGQDYDVIYSQAYLGLVMAALHWNPDLSHNGEDGWGPYAVQRINWAVSKLWKANAADRLHVQPCGVPLPEHADKTIACKPQPESRLEVCEEVERRLRKLPPEQRAVLRMVVGKGMGYREAASALNCSRQYVHQLLVEARTRARRSATAGHLRHAIHRWEQANPERAKKARSKVLAWQHDNPRKYKQVLRRASLRSAQSRKREAALSLTLGVVIATGWYAVDHGDRTVLGPYHKRWQAEGADRLTSRKTGRQYGWSSVGVLQGEVLSLVANHPGKNSAQLAQVGGIAQERVKGTLVKLRGRGLLRLERKHRNSQEAGWHLTDLAINTRAKPLLVVKGEACRPFLDSGYTPLPARPLERGPSRG